MATGRFININFPFKDSKQGFFLDLTSADNQAIKADLLHLLLTRKGQRLYLPDFGTDLLKFIFEPEDGITFEAIKTDINNEIQKYLPNLQMNDLVVEQSPDSEYAVVVTLQYTITDGVFETSDILTINL
jgi:phage baseplate assembly protein W